MRVGLITAGINVFLALVLLYRGHWQKYKVLFASLIYAVMAGPIVMAVYHHYGTSSHQYDVAYRIDKLSLIVFNLGIIFEAWRWRNKCVRIPQEVYVLLTLCAFVAEKAELFRVGDFLHDALRWINLVITCWWVYIFLPEVNHERRDFRAERRPE